MRAALTFLSLVLAGCGRFGFDDTPRDAPDTGTSFRSLCHYAQVTVVDNGLTVDDMVGATLASTLAGGCGNAPATTTVAQDASGILDPTGRPLVSPDQLVVIGGGDGPNKAIAYLLQADTPVIWSSSSQATYHERATGRLIASGPVSSTHDYAVVMVVDEPIGGTRILSASGQTVNGTKAASFWFTTQLAPVIATELRAWAVVEWTDTDGDATPSAGDTWAVAGSG